MRTWPGHGVISIVDCGATAGRPAHSSLADNFGNTSAALPLTHPQPTIAANYEYSRWHCSQLGPIRSDKTQINCTKARPTEIIPSFPCEMWAKQAISSQFVRMEKRSSRTKFGTQHIKTRPKHQRRIAMEPNRFAGATPPPAALLFSVAVQFD